MTLRVRVKFCGFTRVKDAVFAAHLGADAIGLVFYKPSPRNVSVSTAQQIVAALPPFISKIGLFVNATQAEVQHILSNIPLDCLQFHGDENEDFCRSFSLPYIKAIRMSSDIDVSQLIQRYTSASGILLDAWHEKIVGGTGKTFDWARVPMNSPIPIILAGGLTVDNVADAIQCVHPYAVDVSGGIESAKGIKDQENMTTFINEVNKIELN